MEFRTLVAGGGTDGGLSFMAEQLNHTNAEAVYIDFSATSISIARIIIRIRKLYNVVWVRDWIEHIPRLGMGIFDMIMAGGVLHHLKSPHKGLKIINQAQAEYGGAGLLVYGKYGRTGVYQIQELLRITNKQEEKLGDEIETAEILLKILPEGHWLHHFEIGSLWENWEVFKAMGNVEMYDLLLHKRDICYSALDLYEWLESGGYHLVDFSLPENRESLSLKTKILQNFLYDKLQTMIGPKQQAVAELISGHIAKHEAFISTHKDSQASLEDPENVIFAYGSPLGIRNIINNKHNYRRIRNETYICTKLARGGIDEFAEKSKSDFNNYRDFHNYLVADFVWPVSEFGNFVVDSLTKKPTKPKTICKLINDFE